MKSTNSNFNNSIKSCQKTGTCTSIFGASVAYMLLAFSVALVDRLTKWWALDALSGGLITPDLIKHGFNSRELLADGAIGSISQEVAPFLSFSLVFNRGVSWGMFASSCDAIFMAVTGLIFLVLAFFIWHTYVQASQRLCIAGEVLVLTGAVCNLVDRYLYCGVVDFIVVSYKDFVWPVFNIADCAIVIGVGLMILMHVMRAPAGELKA